MDPRQVVTMASPNQELTREPPSGGAARRGIVTNLGSEARDHLANERTFLAWVRTALGFVGFGVLVARLSGSRTHAWTLIGIAFIALGGACLVYSSWRYAKVARYLRRNEFPIAQIGPIALGVAVAIVAVGALLFVALG